MDFKKREGYSLGKGLIYQISQDEFVSSSYSSPNTVITWMKGTKRAQHIYDSGAEFGGVANAFFCGQTRTIKKAELKNDQIVVTESVKIVEGFKCYFKLHCYHYFIERDNYPNVSFAIPVNEDYRSSQGIKFNIPIGKLREHFKVHIQGNFLFSITKTNDSTIVRRYKADSDEYLEKNDLPTIYNQSMTFNNYLFYLSDKGDLISVDMNDLSYEIMKTNMAPSSQIVGIDQNGIVNVQTHWAYDIVDLLSAKLPEKYLANKPKLIDSNNKETEELVKRIEELERKVENEKKEKENVLKTKNMFEKIVENEQKSRNELERKLEDKEKKEAELEKQNESLVEEMKDLKLKYNKLLLRVSTWDSDHAVKK